jgi:predicted lipid-binding transport protein (Tim44 family)
MRKVFVACLGLLALALLCDLPQSAEARRMGGGKSFGSKPQYQRSAPATPQRDAAGPAQRQDPQVQGAQAPRAPGFLGGGRGMLGGLLMGGLIGSLLFGGGEGMGGPGLLDILLIGGGLFLLFRFLKARRMAAESAGNASYYEAQSPVRGVGGIGGVASISAAARNIPKGFDEKEFLIGAKAAYTRLQSSWDKRDLEDIRQFTSPEVWEELRQQAEEEPNPGYTGIVSLKADLLEVKREGKETVASVLFDVLLREKNKDDSPEAVQEIWHFSQDESQPGSFWRLEGIQQVSEE